MLKIYTIFPPSWRSFLNIPFHYLIGSSNWMKTLLSHPIRHSAKNLWTALKNGTPFVNVVRLSVPRNSASDNLLRTDSSSTFLLHSRYSNSYEHKTNFFHCKYSPTSEFCLYLEHGFSVQRLSTDNHMAHHVYFSTLVVGAVSHFCVTLYNEIMFEVRDKTRR